MNIPVPFHEWKARQIARDSTPGIRLYRPREWYWAAYSRYVTKCKEA